MIIWLAIIKNAGENQPMRESRKDGYTFKKTLGLTRRFLPYFKPYAGEMSLDLFCASLTTVCELVLPLIIRYITDMAANDLEQLTVKTVLLLGAAYLAMRAVDTVARYFMTTIGHMTGAKIETDLRRDLFAHLQTLSFSFFDNVKTGQLMSRITTDLNDITEFAHHFPEELFIAAIKIVASFIILSRMNVPLTLIIFAFLPLMLVCSSGFSKKRRAAMRQSRHELGELNAHVEDSLLGVRVVKSFANEDIENDKFHSANEIFLNVKRGMFKYMGGFDSMVRLFDGLMYIVVVVAGALFMINGRITSADYVAYLLYVSTLLTSIQRIVEFTEQFHRGITGIERMMEIMDIEPSIHDLPYAVPIESVKGDIAFEDVSFTYPGANAEVLCGIDLRVNAGASIALVGPSGSGKTTFLSLIPRFYEVTSGRVTIDGRDIRDFTLSSLRENIGVVQQDVYLFSGSVYDNIEYGKPGASREEIIEAAKLADAHEFISAFEDGYDTYVGEHGTKLSGGQKQRISIARVFLKNPPILILDEATSALDNESEQIVQKSLEKLMKGRTTFMIAHRLTTILNASQILVLTENGIEEQGTHEELMRKRGIYHSLYKTYQRALESA